MNDILKYTSKDYNSIYEDLKSAIPSLTDLWTNTNDGDPGIVLVKLMSALGDMLSFNFDKQSLEYYSSTVTQRKNAAKLFKLIGYKMKWYQSATNTITVTNSTTPPSEVILVQAYDYWREAPEDHDREVAYEDEREKFKYTHTYQYYPQYYNYDVEHHQAILKDDSDLIPIVRTVANAWINDAAQHIYLHLGITNPNANLKLFNNSYDNIPYLIVPNEQNNSDITNNTINYDYDIAPGQSANLDVVQGVLVNYTFTENQLKNNRFYFSESAIDENHMWLSWQTSGSVSANNSAGYFSKVDNLLTTRDGELHFEFGVDDYDHPYIEISDYWRTKIPQGQSVQFTVYYIRTMGMFGSITKNYLKTIEGLPNNRYTITHPANTIAYYDDIGNIIALPGQHPELPHDAYINSLNWVTTFDSLVTIFDFERFCKRQPDITNAIAIDKQRNNDLNTAVNKQAISLGFEQLVSYAKMSSEYSDSMSLTDLQELYVTHKSVHKDDWEPESTYEIYSLQLHLIWSYFETVRNNADNTTTPVAEMKLVTLNNDATINNKYLLYRLKVDLNEPDNNSPVIKHINKTIKEKGVVTVQTGYSAVRVFPWHCCGTIHLKAPVTKTVADTIIRTVIQHLAQAFGPQNLEFGKTIKYMDIINTVMNAHEYIRYFDAGLGNKKLIYIDENMDFSYFNDTSLMYYAQRQDSYDITLYNASTYPIYGNGVQTIDVGEPGSEQTLPNHYYNLLSIAPEYILDD